MSHPTQARRGLFSGRTLRSAALLAVLAGGAPFLCLLPGFGPQNAPANQAAPAGPTAPPAAATAAPAPAQDPLLLWDSASGSLQTVPVTAYLIGAAACEMPIDWPDDALRAQMVASHSYILYQKEHGSRAEGQGYLTVNSDQCSGWTTQAVLESRWGDAYAANYARLAGLAAGVQYDVLLYGGAPAAACYHAVSCGRTEASQRVWVETLPYLQGVESAWDKDAEDYEVTVQYTSQQLYDALAMNLGVTPTGGPEGWVGDASWDDAGYVARIRLCGQWFSGAEGRAALSLRSACFAIAWRDGAFAVTTRGYGHGVGMSQAGARAMARGGAGWREILAYYFPGTVLGQFPESTQ